MTPGALTEIGLTADQRLLRDTIAAFMRREAAPERLSRIRRRQGGHDADLFGRAAELGWFGVCIPERYGGSEMPMADAAMVFEELGRGPFPGPLFAQLLSSQILLEAGSDEQRETYLPAIVQGATIVAVAAIDDGRGWGPERVTSQLRRSGDHLVLDGHKTFVHDAEHAGSFIVAARYADDLDGGIELIIVPRESPGVTVAPRAGLLSGIAEVRFEAVDLTPAGLVGEPGDGWPILERAAAATIPMLCAYQVGACADVHAFTLAYTNERFAFGQAIGRFQRVQDHVVELANQMDGATWITRELIWQLSVGDSSLAALHEAKAVASEAYYQACNYSHMVHAGPGTDLDHPLMTHTLTSRSLYQFLGDPTHHKRQMMDALFPPGARPITPRPHPSQ